MTLNKELMGDCELDIVTRAERRAAGRLFNGSRNYPLALALCKSCVDSG